MLQEFGSHDAIYKVAVDTDIYIGIGSRFLPEISTVGPQAVATRSLLELLGTSNIVAINDGAIDVLRPFRIGSHETVVRASHGEVGRLDNSLVLEGGERNVGIGIVIDCIRGVGGKIGNLREEKHHLAIYRFGSIKLQHLGCAEFLLGGAEGEYEGVESCQQCTVIGDGGVGTGGKSLGVGI